MPSAIKVFKLGMRLGVIYQNKPLSSFYLGRREKSMRETFNKLIYDAHQSISCLKLKCSSVNGLKSWLFGESNWHIHGDFGKWKFLNIKGFKDLLWPFIGCSWMLSGYIYGSNFTVFNWNMNILMCSLYP